MVKYSLIVPVYNRPNEVDELLSSLANQIYRDFDVVIVEDGSTEDCRKVVDDYSNDIPIHYYYKPNTGPGDSRNFGMQQATGDYYIFVDSDCILPQNYFAEINQFLNTEDLDCFGGPDDAHPSFTTIQKAINHTMTSTLTTGGIRGKKKQVDKFQPRSFNMGLKKEVFEQVGGFGNIHPGEDPDLSYRIMNAGYTTGLVSNARVFHKRRIDLKKFWIQVYKFGVVRVILGKWHPGTLKVVYAFPSAFLLFTIFSLLLSLVDLTFLIPLGLYISLVFLESLLKTKSLLVSIISIPASFIQLWGYGYGFMKAILKIKFMKMDEKKAFPKMFFQRA